VHRFWGANPDSGIAVAALCVRNRMFIVEGWGVEGAGGDPFEFAMCSKLQAEQDLCLALALKPWPRVGGHGASWPGLIHWDRRGRDSRARWRTPPIPSPPLSCALFAVHETSRSPAREEDERVSLCCCSSGSIPIIWRPSRCFRRWARRAAVAAQSKVDELASAVRVCLPAALLPCVCA
jgi:hypothetical protein